MKKSGTPMEDTRKRMGLKVEDIARLAGISYWQALRTLRGESAKLSVVKKIYRALKMDPGRIFD